ncbi:hypothetical protein OH76DRAFT_771062 [Lentinus brumalis]|uniref:Uncharacterized protein n=1 Tax=Lentinus brumalis TaxID=2498619 RepID=A0A371D4S4_9APHY|nr:hypothetical protein OH76DRAFT_771062 [Polyporus brumalis]
MHRLFWITSNLSFVPQVIQTSPSAAQASPTLSDLWRRLDSLVHLWLSIPVSIILQVNCVIAESIAVGALDLLVVPSQLPRRDDIIDELLHRFRSYHAQRVGTLSEQTSRDWNHPSTWTSLRAGVVIRLCFGTCELGTAYQRHECNHEYAPISAAALSMYTSPSERISAVNRHYKPYLKPVLSRSLDALKSPTW